MTDGTAIHAAVWDTVRQSLADRLGASFDGNAETGWDRLTSLMPAVAFQMYLRDLEARITKRLQLEDRDIVPRAMGLVANRNTSFDSFVDALTTAIVIQLDGDPDFGGTKPDRV